MSPGSWFLVGALSVSAGLALAGAIRLLLGTRLLARHAAAMDVADIDLERLRTAVEKLQNDLVKARMLIARAEIALRGIDAGFRAMLRALAGG